MRIFALGGTGFIGPPVVRRLIALGHEVAILHRGETEAELPGSVEHLHGDRIRLAEFAEDFRRLAPDVVLDLTALTEQDARSAVDNFRGLALRLVVISSQDVYRAYGRFHRKEDGPLEPAPVTEDSALRSHLYPYRGQIPGLDDYEKILVEHAAGCAPELPVTILRLPAVYGEGDQQHRLAVELRRMDDGRRAILLDERLARWRWTRAYVENPAAAIVLAVTDERAAGRTYNVGDEDTLTYSDWVRAIGVAAEWPGDVILMPPDRLTRGLRPPPGDYDQHLVADSARIRRELGYREVISRDEGLRRAVAWEREHRAQLDPKLLDYYDAEDALLRENEGKR